MRTPLPFRRRADALLVACDLLFACGACWVALVLRFDGVPDLATDFRRSYAIATAAAAVLWVVSARSTGLYRRSALRLGTSNVEPSVLAAAAVGVLLVPLNAFFLDGLVSRGWIALVVPALTAAGLLSRGLLRRSRRLLAPFGLGLERYAVLGEAYASTRLLNDLTRAPGAPFRVVTSLSEDLPPDEVVAAIGQLRLDGLILPAGTASLAGHLAPRLAELGVDVLVAPEFGQLESRVASIAVLHGVPLLRVAGLSPRRKARRSAPRRQGRSGVAILGTRGIPANYGGFETFAEQLAVRLAASGTATTVYCRRHYATAPSPWHGVRLVVLPTIRSKHLDTVVHTFLSVLHLAVTGGPRDVVLCNAANAPVLLLLRVFRRRVVLNVDGLEWRRSKWGIVGRSWYRMGEWLSVRFADVLVTDAREVQTYYRVRHDADSVMITYGATFVDRGQVPVPSSVPVLPDRYALYVSRWERENNPLLVVTAHQRSGVDIDLVVLGGATYDEQLELEVRAAAGARTHLPGPLYGEPYWGLQANAAVYIHATEVGGTHPALVEALGAGNLCLVLDTPENREVAGAACVFFADEESLAERLRWVTSLSPAELAEWRARARAHAERHYSWDAVAQSYLHLITGKP